jgi:hypothetical protein
VLVVPAIAGRFPQGIRKQPEIRDIGLAIAVDVPGDRARDDNNLPGARHYVIENKKSGSYKDKEKEKKKSGFFG